jgi:hypothetical protein
LNKLEGFLGQSAWDVIGKHHIDYLSAAQLLASSVPYDRNNHGELKDGTNLYCSWLKCIEGVLFRQ